MKSTPVVKGDIVYINGFGSPENNPGSKVPVMTTDEAFEKHDANKDGKLTREEMPDAARAAHGPRVRRPRRRPDAAPATSGTTTRRRWSPTTASSRSRWAASGDMTAKSVKWKYHRGIPQLPSPLIYENVLYMVNDGGGIVTMLNPEYGGVAEAGPAAGRSDTFYASPVAGDGKVYIAEREGAGLRPASRPNLEPIVVNDMQDGIYATPALVDGRIYLRTLNTLYCFGKL